MPRPRPSLRRLPALGLAAALCTGLALPADAQSSNLLILDADAGYLTDTQRGALFNVDVFGGTTAAPPIEASAQAGAPFEFVSGVAISPVDGRAYIADIGSGVVARILAVDGTTGAVEIIAQGAPLSQPFALAFLPDGRLVIADAEADPSILGSSPSCGNYGAVLVIDTTTCTAPCTPALLSDGTLHGFPPTVRSAFGHPVGIAYDPVRDTIYVADQCVSEAGFDGSLFSVNPSTGRVALVASNAQFLSLINVDVRPDGTPLVVDQGVSGDSVVWSVDVANADTANNLTQFTGGTQYSMIQDVGVDESNRVYLVDWGEYDDITNTFVVPPAIWWVDETDTNAGTNGRLLNESASLLTPVSCAIVPIPKATSCSPVVVTAPTNVIIQGAGLFPGMTVDFGPGAAISAVDAAPGFAPGTAIQALVTPTGTQIVPIGCAGLVDLVLSHPFGGQGVLDDALSLQGATGGIVPAPPGSTKGDATLDGIVDGLDLAALGMHFGAEYCDGLAFLNNADFDNDDIIDGSDLAILAAYFGTRP